MYEVVFLIRTLADIILLAFLVRWLCAVQRADFRNPLVQSLHRLTNPVILPLRRVLPAIGRTDTATVSAVLLIALFRGIVLSIVSGLGWPPTFSLALGVVYALVRMLLEVFSAVILLHAVLTWVADPYNPLSRALSDLSEPILRPIRRIIPLFGGLDLSPLVALVLLRLAANSLAMHFGGYVGLFDL